jgi:hypothetical protein
MRHLHSQTPALSSTKDASSDNSRKKVEIAYAVSLFMCGNHDVQISGLLDSAMVLKHSVELIHRRSKYGYKMYAIVHRNALGCADKLRRIGYNILVRDSFIEKDEIEGDYLRRIVDSAGGGMGSREFLKLHAYNITWHEIVVHVDMDYMFLKSHDHLYDSMLLDPTSKEGVSAREQIVREREPFIIGEKDAPLPNQIDAFFTRDYPLPWPGKVPCFQGGFLILRPSESTFLEYLSVIKTGDYRGGMGNDSGWGGKGYGWLYGCETYQGVVPYYYDILHPGTAVELDGCIYNHMGVSVHYDRGGFNVERPKLKEYKKFLGQCRNGKGMNCNDCRKTEPSDIMSNHFTICGKPWKCDPAAQMPPAHVNFTLCNAMQKEWTRIRFDLEETLDTPTANRNGSFATDIYQGVCMNDGSENYIPINIDPL